VVSARGAHRGKARQQWRQQWRQQQRTAALQRGGGGYKCWLLATAAALAVAAAQPRPHMTYNLSNPPLLLYCLPPYCTAGTSAASCSSLCPARTGATRCSGTCCARGTPASGERGGKAGWLAGCPFACPSLFATAAVKRQIILLTHSPTLAPTPAPACYSLHGGKDQSDRESTIVDFKANVCNILVATSGGRRGCCTCNAAAAATAADDH
jgi:hypothetical protein